MSDWASSNRREILSHLITAVFSCVLLQFVSSVRLSVAARRLAGIWADAPLPVEHAIYVLIAVSGVVDDEQAVGMAANEGRQMSDELGAGVVKSGMAHRSTSKPYR